ncbi:MAG TPA: hypothetical protein VMT46_10455 [Anaerolineaceae bacterium]|nr:hypothetical protein [Anaerolineaceae bacterium]
MFSMALVLLVSACAPREVKYTNPFHQWRTVDVISAFQAAGLPVEIPRLRKDERDIFSYDKAIESQRIKIPIQSELTSGNGLIFSFQNEGDLQEMQEFYVGLGEALPQYDSWIFIKDNLLLQINREIPETVAKRYTAALDLLDEQ